jgi:murein DD-endopeptidase MepM/ murein hydrolase activator NlpD
VHNPSQKPCRRARPRTLLAFFSLASTTWLSTAAASGQATIGSDHATIARLEQRIIDEGTAVQTIVGRYNAVSSQLGVITRSIKHDQARLTSDQKATTTAAQRLRTVAIAAYVNAQFGNSSTVASYTGTADSSAIEERNVYLGTVNGALQSATATLENDRENVAATQQHLQVARQRTTVLLTAVAASKAQAEQAVAADEKTLRGVNSNLLTLVNEANERRDQEREAAAERAIAASAAQAAANASANQSASPPASVTVTPSPGSYSNPLRGLGGLRPERIDQGVDYSGFGAIYAIGDGTVISTYNSGWPAGTFIAYRLSDGPAAGLVVYSAEDIEPTVSVGQTVTARTQIGRVFEGSYGIEIGWADPAGDGATMAADHSQYYGSNSTAFGVNFSQLLSSLGAPGGELEGYASGSVPGGWPQW